MFSCNYAVKYKQLPEKKPANVECFPKCDCDALLETHHFKAEAKPAVIVKHVLYLIV